MCSRRIAFSSVRVLAVIGLISGAFAQSTGGRIIGRVSDSTGAVVTGARVKLVNDATHMGRDTATDQNGDYTFVEVAPGNYHVEYTLQGFKREVRTSVVVLVNQVLTSNGASEET